jgi:hypothetical protein
MVALGKDEYESHHAGGWIEWPCMCLEADDGRDVAAHAWSVVGPHGMRLAQAPVDSTDRLPTPRAWRRIRRCRRRIRRQLLSFAERKTQKSATIEKGSVGRVVMAGRRFVVEN